MGHRSPIMFLMSDKSESVSFQVAALVTSATWSTDFIPTIAEVTAGLATTHAIASCIRDLSRSSAHAFNFFVNGFEELSSKEVE